MARRFFYRQFRRASRVQWALARCLTPAGRLVAGALLAFSYTFWSQAIIAEVYSLHLTLIGLCLIALYAYAAAPTFARLVVFFTIYAAAFGNHLGMVLLLLPFALFLVQTTPARRELFRPRRRWSPSRCPCSSSSAASVSRCRILPIGACRREPKGGRNPTIPT